MSKLPPSCSFVSCISTESAGSSVTYIARASLGKWTVLSIQTSDFTIDVIGAGAIKDNEISSFRLVEWANDICLLMVCPEQMHVISIKNNEPLQIVGNHAKVNGIARFGGPGTFLFHSYDDIYLFNLPLSQIMEEKPLQWQSDSGQFKTLASMEVEFITKLVTNESSISSTTVLIEQTVEVTGMPVVMWASLEAEKKQLMIRWRQPMLSPEAAYLLYTDSVGNERGILFSDLTLLIVNRDGILHIVNWESFGRITAISMTFADETKCVFIAAYAGLGVYGNELDTRDSSVSLTPLEGISMQRSVAHPIIDQIFPIFSANWRDPDFAFLAAVGSVHCGYSLVYSDALITKSSPEQIAYLAQFFDMASNGQEFLHSASSLHPIISVHSLPEDEGVVLQSVIPSHPVHFSGLHLLSNLEASDFNLVKMRTLPSFVKAGERLEDTQLLVLTSASLSCSALMRLSSSSSADVVSGVLVESDHTIAVIYISDQRFLQVTNRQVHCFAMRSGNQWVLETKWDLQLSAAQSAGGAASIDKENLDMKPSKIFHCAKYGEKLIIGCNAHYMAALTLTKLPTLECSFIAVHGEVCAMHELEFSGDRGNWLAIAFWNSSDIMLQHLSPEKKESTETLHVSSMQVDSRCLQVRLVRFVQLQSEALLLVSLSDESLCLYQLQPPHSTSSNLRISFLTSFAWGSFLREVATVSFNLLLLTTTSNTTWVLHVTFEAAKCMISFRPTTLRSTCVLATSLLISGDIASSGSFVALSSPELLAPRSQPIAEKPTTGQAQLLLVKGTIDLTTSLQQVTSSSPAITNHSHLFLRSESERLFVLRWQSIASNQSAIENDSSDLQVIDVFHSVTMERLRTLQLSHRVHSCLPDTLDSAIVSALCDRPTSQHLPGLLDRLQILPQYRNLAAEQGESGATSFPLTLLYFNTHEADASSVNSAQEGSSSNSNTENPPLSTVSESSVTIVAVLYQESSKEPTSTHGGSKLHSSVPTLHLLDLLTWNVMGQDFFLHPPLHATLNEHLLVLTCDNILTLVGYQVSLPPIQDLQDDFEKNDKLLDAQRFIPLRSGRLHLSRLASTRLTTLQLIKTSNPRDEEEYVKPAPVVANGDAQLCCSEDIAVVYVPKQGFEVFRLTSVRDLDVETYQLTRVTSLRDETIDVEHLHVLALRSEGGDTAVKILGHNRMEPDISKACRLHSFCVSRESGSVNDNGIGESVTRIDSYGPLPARLHHNAHVLSLAKGHHRGDRDFEAWRQCQDVHAIVEGCNIIDSRGVFWPATITLTTGL